MKKSFWILLALTIAFVLNACSLEQACTSGQKRCETGKLLTCSSDGNWEEAWDCEDKGQFCDVSTGCVECLSSNDCKDSAKPKCNAKMKVCQSTTAVCAEGEIKCDGNALNTCNVKENDFDKSICVGTKPYCDEAKGCVECRGSGDCSKAKPVCNVNEKSCQTSEAKCAQGEMYCDKSTLIKCNATQSDFDKIVCGDSKPQCLVGKGCVECIDEKDCTDSTKPVCNDITKTCQACILYQTKCEGGKLFTCSVDGTWGTGVDCGNGECLNDLECKSCIQGETKCNNNVFQTCNNGIWGRGLNCEGGECLNKSKCKSCSKNQTKCENNQLFRCSSDGTWENDVKCRYSCDTLGIACAVCVKGEMGCDGNTYKKCNATLTAFNKTICEGNRPFCNPDIDCVECRDSSDCKNPESPFCKETTKLCQKTDVVCEKGEKKCQIDEIRTVFMTCNATQTGFIEQECSGIKGVCDGIKGCIECVSVGECHDSSKPICNTVTNACEKNACVAGQTMCQQDDKIYTCSEGIWPVLGTDPCDKGCNSLNTGCAACKKDEKKCDGSTLLTCNAKRMDFDVTYTCSDNTPICDPRKGCVECIDSNDCKEAAKPICDKTTNTCKPS